MEVSIFDLRRFVNVRIFRFIAYIVTILILSACDTGSPVYAPVSDAATIDPLPKSGAYRVMPGETLYSIAWRYSLDYRSLASRNHLLSPYKVQPGQIIYLKGQAPEPSSRILVSQTPTINKPVTNQIAKNEEPRMNVSLWQWPAHGHVIGVFSELNKGININGRAGDPIYASAAGKVVYSGNGLRGYGNLIIIKHNSTFLTAYAHNSVVFVKADDWVKPGQKIAEMGRTGTPRVMLHFEIRRNGKPENPLVYLGK